MFESILFGVGVIVGILGTVANRKPSGKPVYLSALVRPGDRISIVGTMITANGQSIVAFRKGEGTCVANTLGIKIDGQPRQGRYAFVVTCDLATNRKEQRLDWIGESVQDKPFHPLQAFEV